MQYVEVFAFAHTQVYVHTQAHTSFMCSEHTSTHKCICPGGAERARAFLLIATLLPCCTSAAQVEEEEQRACTVIRFQWGHRRIRQERHYGEKERGVTWQHEPTVVRELHLPIVISCHRVRSLGSCSIWFRRRQKGEDGGAQTQRLIARVERCWELVQGRR